VYVREGCWLCHTRQVRAVVTDVGLGPVSVPGDYAFDPADLLGVTRTGPDLAHIGAREADAAALAARLADPRADRPWSNMPAYGFLSDSDLGDLAAYLTSLE
jgi:cbb3-type cytochrome c oxidase subunit II